jgi:hypothetical protein
VIFNAKLVKHLQVIFRRCKHVGKHADGIQFLNKFVCVLSVSQKQNVMRSVITSEGCEIELPFEFSDNRFYV